MFCHIRKWALVTLPSTISRHQPSPFAAHSATYTYNRKLCNLSRVWYTWMAYKLAFIGNACFAWLFFPHFVLLLLLMLPLPILLSFDASRFRHHHCIPSPSCHQSIVIIISFNAFSFLLRDSFAQHSLFLSLCLIARHWNSMLQIISDLKCFVMAQMKRTVHTHTYAQTLYSEYPNSAIWMQTIQLEINEEK